MHFDSLADGMLLIMKSTCELMTNLIIGNKSLRSKTKTRGNERNINISECRQTTSSFSVSEQRIGTAFSISFLNGILGDIRTEKQIRNTSKGNNNAEIPKTTSILDFEEHER
jgi:hypothetical protein